MRDGKGAHRFRVVGGKIGIFTDSISTPDFETRDGETLVMVSIGVGETHVSVMTDEAERRSQWTAVFGWASLCQLPVGPEDRVIYLEGGEQVSRALRGTLRIYGRPVNTDGFLPQARDHFRSAIGHILDRTIGDGAGYDRIVLAAPGWVHEAVRGCLDLRPHMWQDIQDL